jgi:hypothetical protein
VYSAHTLSSDRSGSPIIKHEENELPLLTVILYRLWVDEHGDEREDPAEEARRTHAATPIYIIRTQSTHAA